MYEYKLSLTIDIIYVYMLYVYNIYGRKVFYFYYNLYNGQIIIRQSLVKYAIEVSNSNYAVNIVFYFE